jgi:hypothetical protein
MRTDPKTLERFMRSVQGLPEAPPASKPDDSEVPALARELYEEFVEELEKQEKRRVVNRALANCQAPPTEDWLAADMALPVEETRFSTLKTLAFHRPELALAKWEEMKAAARHDVANGWHAARTVAFEAWDRACYLAIRHQFRQHWPPRSDVESMLIDEMAQYELFRRILMSDLVDRRWRMHDKAGNEPTGPVILQAIDRLQRLFQYALRTLLSLRRTRTTATVQRIESATHGASDENASVA